MNIIAMEPTLQHYLILAIGLFMIGIIGAVVRRNLIVILVSTYLMFAAAALALVAFARWNLLPEGKAISIFVVAIGISVVASGFALVAKIATGNLSLNVDGLRMLKR